jgi:hypothetical protein
MMQKVNFLLTIAIALLAIACEKDNINLTTSEELPPEPTIIEVESSLIYRVANSSTSSLAASAYKIPGSIPSGASYYVASNDVTIECQDGTAFRASFDGGELFSVLFYGDEFGANVIQADFETVVDGDTITVTNSFPTPNCPRPILSVDYEEEDGRLRGTVSGEFFRLADEIVAPFDSCVNFVSVGILDASFDVAIIPCD